MNTRSEVRRRAAGMTLACSTCLAAPMTAVASTSKVEERFQCIYSAAPLPSGPRALQDKHTNLDGSVSEHIDELATLYLCATTSIAESTGSPSVLQFAARVALGAVADNPSIVYHRLTEARALAFEDGGGPPGSACGVCLSRSHAGLRQRGGHSDSHLRWSRDSRETFWTRWCDLLTSTTVSWKDGATALLRNAIECEDPVLRELGITGLALGPCDECIARTVVRRLDDSDVAVQVAAVRYIETKFPLRRSVPLIATTAGRGGPVAYAAVELIGRGGVASPVIDDGLVSFIGSADVLSAVHALSTLARVATSSGVVQRAGDLLLERLRAMGEEASPSDRAFYEQQLTDMVRATLQEVRVHDVSCGTDSGS